MSAEPEPQRRTPNSEGVQGGLLCGSLAGWSERDLGVGWTQLPA